MTEMSEAKPLDREPVQALAEKFLVAIREHYKARSMARATAQEVLNALAGVTAVIIMGAKSVGDEEGARAFFSVALEGQLREMENGEVP